MQTVTQPKLKSQPPVLTLAQKQKKLAQLKADLAKYQEKLNFKMKRYRGVIHESASSELRHSEVMVLTAMVNGLREEVYSLEQEIAA